MKNNILPLIFAALTCALSSESAEAALSLPPIISDHMVLQSQAADPIWGNADPGETVTVKIGAQAKTAVADAAGNWKVVLDPLAVGGPYTLSVTGTGADAAVVNDVLAGEVWLGAGQSNMGFPVKEANHFAEEKAAADFPQVRMFAVATELADQPQANVRGKWIVTTPETVGNYSAILYFFGRELHQTLKVPVGLIKAAVGGTTIELWMDRDKQQADPKLQDFFKLVEKEKAAFDPVAAEQRFQLFLAKRAETAKATGKPLPPPLDPAAKMKRNTSFGGLYNGMIAPLAPYHIRGVIWSQGETNAQFASHAVFYQEQFPLLIQNWREKWGYDFPFAWAQISTLESPAGDWPIVREAMLKTLTLPHTGMAVTIDLGEKVDRRNPHYKEKEPTGHRLALWALGSVYGKDAPTSSPLPEKTEVKGSDFVVTFSHADGGLVAHGPLDGFVIAGADHQWKPGIAHIKGEQVVINSPDVKAPVAVRYDWADVPIATLFSATGLPATPFRTDENIETPAKNSDEGEHSAVE